MTGRWAARFGGRFNRMGREALYTSLHPATAVREVHRTRRWQPMLFVAFEADLVDLMDARASGFDEALLAAEDWQERMVEDGIAPTQRLAEDLIAQGCAGLLVRSFAEGCGPNDLNLVLWRWDSATLRLVDDDGRLQVG